MRSWLVLINAVAVLLLGAVSAIAAAPANSPRDETIPPFSEVRQAVLEYFRARPDFETGDLVTREEVAPLLARLHGTWLSPADAKKILERVPDEVDFLVRQLSTPDGRKFMRRIAKYPDGYDRLDRLGRLPYGHQTVSALIRGPGGEKMIEYMTETPGGKALGQQLSHAPDGRDFNDPTGRIYTMTMLLAQLEKSHAAAMKTLQAKSSR